MKCEKHPENDAIGNCIYCGRGVCDQCKVRVSELIHCKECAEDGRIIDAKPTKDPQARLAPAGTLSKLHMLFYQMPTPRGRTEPGHYRIGALGSLTCSIIGASLSVISLVSVIPPFGGPSMLVLSAIYPLILMFLGILPYAIGLYGFYINLGDRAQLIGTVGLLISTMASVALSIFGIMLTIADPYGPNGGYLLLVGGLIFGIGLVFASYSLWSALRYLPPDAKARRYLWRGMFFTQISAVFFMTMIGTVFIGWLMFAIAQLYMFGAFQRMPIPVRIPIERFTKAPRPVLA